VSTPTRARTRGRSGGPNDGAANDGAPDGGAAGPPRKWWRRRTHRGKSPAERPPSGHPRRWPWILALTLVGALLCGAVYTVFFSPLLGVTAVAVTGAPDAVAAKVLAAADVPTGTPLARVDLDDVAARVEAIPEVAAVEVARGWPDTLSITVTPRVPVAVTSANGRFYLLDDSGDPYLAVDAPPAGLVTVQLVAPGVGDPSTTAALTVAAVLTPDFRATVASISARTAFDVELTLVDGRKIIWGEATDSAQKMQILPALLAAKDGNEYDVTDPTLVSVR
jgi:cell division protein FtsQ